MNYMKFDDACGRYGLRAKPADIAETYDLGEEGKKILNELEKQGLLSNLDVKPTNSMPVVIAGEDGKPKVEVMKWGFNLEPKNRPKMLLFNTRDDNAFKGFWKPMILRRRALIPATGYFEWTKTTPKRKYYFHPKHRDVYSFAGVWSTWKDIDGEEKATYSIITTEPNKEAKAVHNRMPVILHQEDQASWLEPSRDKQEVIEPFLHPLEDDGLEVREVSSDVRDLEYSDERIIAPLNSQ
jgi:putative SOS response-associated peptidase YedK